MLVTLQRTILLPYVTGWRKPGWRWRRQRSGASAGAFAGAWRPWSTRRGGTSTYKVGNALAHILLFMRRAQKGPQLGPRAHFLICSKFGGTPVMYYKKTGCLKVFSSLLFLLPPCPQNRPNQLPTRISPSPWSRRSGGWAMRR